MVDKCQSETKTDLTLPFDQKKTLIFIDWLVRIRKVSAATVNTYLSGVRQLHIVNNIDLPILRSNLTKLILKGISNRDGIKKRSERNHSRLPMTINTMLVFKNTIVSSHLNNNDKRLVWAVATLAFAGAFRLGELLSKHEATFDPDFTLLTKDIKRFHHCTNYSKMSKRSKKCDSHSSGCIPERRANLPSESFYNVVQIETEKKRRSIVQIRKRYPIDEHKNEQTHASSPRPLHQS
jgi:hypothetical protein